MTQVYQRLAPKKPTNVSINSDLLAQAKGLQLNLSATLENALAQEIRKAQRTNWLEENRTAIDAANHLTDENGLFSDSYRTL